MYISRALVVSKLSIVASQKTYSILKLPLPQTCLGRIPLIANVLIIDDDPGIRKMLSTLLENEGYLTEIVGKGKDAVKACKKTPFDIALIDIGLPDLQGIELIRMLKEAQPRIITIIVTGIPSLENAVKAVNERADAYITKPIQTGELVTTIAKLLKQRSNEYLWAFADASRQIDGTPNVKYQTPDKW
jgi:DNA-binding response OmpR family regulator